VVQDGYKLIEAPHLGMERRGVAYGNKFKNGYSGRVSGTGGASPGTSSSCTRRARMVGNSITVKDAADMWIPRLRNYSRAYAECKDRRRLARSTSSEAAGTSGTTRRSTSARTA
jgi:hypothetical protein